MPTYIFKFIVEDVTTNGTICAKPLAPEFLGQDENYALFLPTTRIYPLQLPIIDGTDYIELDINGNINSPLMNAFRRNIGCKCGIEVQIAKINGKDVSTIPRVNNQVLAENNPCIKSPLRQDMDGMYICKSDMVQQFITSGGNNKTLSGVITGVAMTQ